MKWHTTVNIDKSSPDKITMEVEINDGSPWFSGHFPDDPVLPGIAQIAMAFEAVKHLRGGDAKITEVKKIRFKQIIKPNDRVTINVSPTKGNTYKFRILSKGELACNGILSVK